MSSLSGLNSNGLMFSGLATGINTDTIIAGLTKINQRRIDTLKAQESTIAAKQSLFVTLQASVFDLQSRAASLARSAGGAFDGRQVTVSDTSALTAVAGTAALPGTYTLTVNSLAQAHQLASNGFAEPTTLLKEGTISLQVGDAPAVTITVDNRNNTLRGLADSINATGIGVRASIINDGSETPYRLLLTSTSTGSANTIQVNAALTEGSGGDLNPTALTIQHAADAAGKLGTGEGALVVTSGSNRLNNLIPGLSINLLRADVGKPTTLSVAPDTAAASKAVQELVAAYNSVVDFINQQSAFDPKTQTGGPLLGNRDARQLINDLSGAITAAVPGLNNAANRLSSVGLSFDNTGRLLLDLGKLERVLNGETGANIGDLKKLFGLTGSVANNPGVEFLIGTDKTRPSGTTPYQVNITAPATRASITASGPPLMIWPPDTSLLLKLNGIAGEVTIPSGEYTPEELVAMLQRQINSTAAFTNNSVTVGYDDNGALQITSQRYGTGSKVEITGGSAAEDLGFNIGANATGSDVEGHFVVNGVIEAATGNGQILRGNAANANTDGLQMQINLTAPGTAALTVTQGLASRLNQLLGKYLDTTSGRFQAINSGYQKSIDDLTTAMTKQNELMQRKQAELTRQFAAMESAVNNLKGLQTQLAGLFTNPTNR